MTRCLFRALAFNLDFCKRSNIWRDANGNGSQNSGELETFGVKESPDGCFFYPDSTGGIWKTNGNGTSATGVSKLRYFPVQGLDANGNPQYSYATSENYTLPELYEFKRVEYDAPNDVMYAAGSSASGALGGDWGVAGNKLVRYNNFRNNSTRTVAWSIALPFSDVQPAQHLNVKAIAEAGDYLFLAAYREGRIYVHKKSDGSKVGEILPTALTGNTSGWSDIVGAIRATKRSNGEYLIFAEENGFGKVNMYRWNSAPSNLRTTVASRTQINLDWTENSSNESGFAVERSANGTSWSQIATVATDAVSYVNTGLKGNTLYFYRVRALNSGDNSPYSNTASVKTLK